MHVKDVFHHTAQILVQGRIDPSSETQPQAKFIRGLYLEHRENVWNAVERAAAECDHPWEAMTIRFYIRRESSSKGQEEEFLIESWTICIAGKPRLHFRQTNSIFRTLYLHLRLAPFYSHKLKSMSPLPVRFEVVHHEASLSETSTPKRFRRMSLYNNVQPEGKVTVNFDYFADLTWLLSADETPTLSEALNTMLLEDVERPRSRTTSTHSRPQRLNQLQQASRERTRTWSGEGPGADAILQARERVRSKERLKSQSDNNESSTPNTASQPISIPSSSKKILSSEEKQTQAMTAPGNIGFHNSAPRRRQASATEPSPSSEEGRKRTQSFGLRMPSLDSSEGSFPTSPSSLKVGTWQGSHHFQSPLSRNQSDTDVHYSQNSDIPSTSLPNHCDRPLLSSPALAANQLRSSSRETLPFARSIGSPGSLENSDFSWMMHSSGRSSSTKMRVTPELKEHQLSPLEIMNIPDEDALSLEEFNDQDDFDLALKTPGGEDYSIIDDLPFAMDMDHEEAQVQPQQSVSTLNQQHQMTSNEDDQFQNFMNDLSNDHLAKSVFSQEKQNLAASLHKLEREIRHVKNDISIFDESVDQVV